MHSLFTKTKNIPLYALQAIAVMTIAFSSLRLSSYDLKVPFNYNGDSIIILMYIKGMLLNGWTFNIPQLSAPFGMNAAAFPVMTNFDWLIMKAISLFTSEPGLILNSFWLLTLVLSATTSTISMRLLDIDRTYAFCAGILYAFLPYALLRNVAHLNLAYYLVPLLGLLAIHIATGLTNKKNRLILWVSYLACVAQGFNYIYYSFFAVLLFSFAAIVGYLNTKSRRVLFTASVAIGLIIFSATANLSPSIYSWVSSGKPPEMNYKYPAEAEIYGAKMRKLIAPHQQNPIPGLHTWGARDVNNAYPNENENTTARLGLAASVGFIMLLLFSLRAIRATNSEHEGFLNALAALSLFTLLFITTGGAGAIFNLLFFSDIRAYNRFSVFLAFFSLLGLVAIPRIWTPTRQHANWLMHFCFILLFSLSLYDQLLDRFSLIRGQSADTEQYRIDRSNAEDLQALYPTGANILELPLTGFPPLSIHERMQSYDHLRPFLWGGENMRWSWPSFSQQHRVWQEKVSAEPPGAIVEAAVYSGFDAIWIDRYAYKDAAEQLISTLKAAGADQKLDFPRYALLDLAQIKQQLQNEQGEREFSQNKKTWLYPPRVVWGKGFYHPEINSKGMNFRWSSNSSNVTFFNDEQEPKSIKIDFDIASEREGIVSLDSGAIQKLIDSNSVLKHSTLELTIPAASRRILSFKANMARVNAVGDPRDIYFYVANFTVTEHLTDTKETHK